jgi:beta-glucuronidase
MYIRESRKEFMRRQILSLGHRWCFALDRENIGIRDGWYKQGIPVYREVSLPHTYNIESGTETYRGVVWYEYHLDYDESFVGKRLRLQCNGIYRDADFWFNGENAGRHYGSGFTTFFIELPNNIHTGKTNVLTVRVQNQFTFDALPQGTNFDWADDGGIFREVTLIVTDTNAIDYVQIFAEPKLANTGISQHTADAEFSAAVHLCGPANVEQPLAVYYEISRITESDRNITKPVFKSENYHISEGKEYSLPLVRLKEVSLWHFDRPCLYRLNLFLTCSNEICDEYTVTFGFRKFEVKETSFIFNGETVRLAGTEWMPGSNPAYGNAEPKEYIYRILTQLKTSNCVFTRFHWQQDEALYDWCDRNGMLVQEEIPSWGRPFPPGEAEMNLSKAQADEMIRSHGNHPSIVSWGMANELKGQAPETSVFMRELKAYFKKIDPMRLVSYVSHTIWDGPAKDATRVGDMMMVNDYCGQWLADKDSETEIGKIFAEISERPLVISEFGLCEPRVSGGDKRRISDFIHKMNVYRKFPAICGIINFCLNDYRTQMGEEGTGVLRRRVHGSTDIFGEPKPSYYVVQEECSPVRIVSAKLTNEKLMVEIRCSADIPSYEIDGYYLEYKDINGKIIYTEQIPPLKPGNTIDFEYTNKDITMFCIYRPNGFLVLEKEIMS